MTKVFVTGEGVGEIGKWAEARERRATSTRGDGVLKALFDTKRTGTVIEGRSWKSIATLRPGSRGDGKTLEKAAVLAEEAGADLLLWSRDTDGDRDRAPKLEASMRALKEAGDRIDIIGGVQDPALEAWIVAIAGLDKAPDTRSKLRLAELLAERGLDHERAMCELISTAEKPIDTSRSPSLKRWMDQLGSD